MKTVLFRAAALFAATIAAAACNVTEQSGNAAADRAAVAPILTTEDAQDVHSFARPQEARVSHVALDLGVDFDSRKLGGTATLDIDRKPEAKEIVLDTRGLEVASVADAKGKPLDYRVGAGNEILGAPLTVALRPDTRRIVIRYASGKDAAALLWLTPEQTAGKKQPYLFSQGQSIETRSWVPTQDSPGIRQTWEATIRVPAGLTAVMSAPRSAEPLTQGGETAFSFRMDKSVAPYMIAIAVGDLAFRSLGPRSGVWTEPSMLDAAAKELEDTEKMIDAAERLFGPYRWGRYDMLVLPPSFPFGGMENPVMTFLTPTFIAGDKSLVSLIAHELAHSWSGNLATNATWSDFWLNEGTTTYAERRIIEAIYGPEVAEQQGALGIDLMNVAVTDAGGPKGADTRLHLDLKGRHPDDGSTDIAYEKGAIFLRTVEAAVGRERFDAYMRGWFERNAFKPVTSKIFLADLREHLVEGDKALEAKLGLDSWVYEVGIPANMVKPDPAAFAAVDKAVREFAAGKRDVAAWGDWNTDERLRFLTTLPAKLPKPALDHLGTTLALNEARNNEVLAVWLKIAVGNRYDPAVPALERFLGSVGRIKFIKPLYTALAADKQWGMPIAQRALARSSSLYHPLLRREIDKLKISSATPVS